MDNTSANFIHEQRVKEARLKLSGNKVVVPLKQEVYTADDVPECDERTQAMIDRVEANTKRILREEIFRIQYKLKPGSDEPVLQPDMQVFFKQRLAEAQECLDYYD